MRASLLLASGFALLAHLSSGCGGASESAEPPDSETPSSDVGRLDLSLEVLDGSVIDEVSFTISRNGEVVDTGTIDASELGPTAPIQVAGLEAGAGYTVTFTARSADGAVSCDGSADFEVATDAVTDLYVYLRCTRPVKRGSLRPDGRDNYCAQVGQVVVSPSTANVGGEISLSASAWDVEDDPVEFWWSALGGSIANTRTADTVFTCTEPGSFLVAATVSDNDPQCFDSWEVTVTCVVETGDECTVDDDCIGVFPVANCYFPTTCEFGICTRGDRLPTGTSCLRGGECLAGRCLDEGCKSDSDCQVFDDPVECVEARTCESDPLDVDRFFCRDGRPLPEGTPCTAGACNGFGECVGNGNPVKSQVVRVACKNSVAVDPSYLPSLLTVRPPITWKSDPTETDIWGIGGEARFDKEFLDAAQAVIPGGVTVAILHDLKWTVQVRSGATMDDVVLRSQEIPHSCEFDRNVLCDPDNDLPDGAGNSGCLPVGADNRCERFVQLAVSSDCTPNGFCESEGATPTAQCAANGFCVADVLRLPLQEQQVEVTPTAAGQNITFTWYETSDRGFHQDGTMVLPTAVFSEPTGPVGFRTEVSGVSAALECMGGGDANWTLNGPLPVPDSLLLQYFVPAAAQ